MKKEQDAIYLVVEVVTTEGIRVFDRTDYQAAVGTEGPFGMEQAMQLLLYRFAAMVEQLTGVEPVPLLKTRALSDDIFQKVEAVSDAWDYIGPSAYLKKGGTLMRWCVLAIDRKTGAVTEGGFPCE